MDIVDELELVSLQVVTHEDLNDVVLPDELKDQLSHNKVALNIVRATKRAKLVHNSKMRDESVVRGLQRIQVVLEGRATIPVLNIKELEDVTDVVLLVKSLLFLVLEGLEDFADFREMLNELFN